MTMPEEKKKKPDASAPRSSALAPTPSQRPAALDEATDDAATDDTRDLSRGDVRFLGEVLRFLVHVQQPSLARIALANGYSPEEHQEGLRLHRTAVGDNLPLPVVFGLATADEPGSAMPTLRRIDAFENLWFPRTRAIIQRVVPETHRARFEAQFFHELSQQPLGPAVVGSVHTWIARVEALATSHEPGAREVRATLRKRGLTDTALAEMKSLVESATAFVAPAAPNADHAPALPKVRADRLAPSLHCAASPSRFSPWRNAGS